MIYLAKNGHGDRQGWRKAIDAFLYTLSVNLGCVFLGFYLFIFIIPLHVCASPQMILAFSEKGRL